MDITGLIQISPDYRRFPLQLPRNFPENKALSRIVQHRPLVRSHLFNNPVGKPPEAEHIYIHNPFTGMHRHQVHLRLHRKLIRHNDQEIPIRLFPGALNDFFVKPRTF